MANTLFPSMLSSDIAIAFRWYREAKRLSPVGAVDGQSLRVACEHLGLLCHPFRLNMHKMSSGSVSKLMRGWRERREWTERGLC